MTKRSAGARGGRGRNAPHARVRTAKGRAISSTKWLARQLNDPYIARARRQGYRARSAFKLVEIDEKHAFLRGARLVVDLGAAPGSWSQVARERIRGDGRVIAIDRNAMAPIEGVDIVALDLLSDDAPACLKALLSGQAVDVVLSDMAAPATGQPSVDHLRIMALCESAADFACSSLAPGGTFLAKVLRGGTEGKLLRRLKRNFRSVRHVKPPASRMESAEMYVLAQGFRGEERAPSLSPGHEMG